MTADEKRTEGLFNLLKYPVILFTILVGLGALQIIWNIDPAKISEIGPDGVKIAKETRSDASVALADMEISIASLEARLAAVESLETNLRPQELGDHEQISDATARLSRTRGNDGETIMKGKSGAIFLGRYGVSTSEWQTVMLTLQSGESFSAPPSEISIGNIFKVDSNLVLRDDLPPNDNLYYRARENLGVIPKGSRIEITGEPTEYVRGDITSYWALVRVLD